MIRFLVVLILVLAATTRLVGAASLQQINRTAFFAVDGREVYGIAVGETYKKNAAPDINEYTVQPVYSVSEQNGDLIITVERAPNFAVVQPWWQNDYLGKLITSVSREGLGDHVIFTLKLGADCKYEVLPIKRRYSYPDDKTVMLQTFVAVRATNKDNPKKLVALDPGHGGTEDRGTTGNNIYEKDANLDIALMTRDYLRKSKIGVYMTRETDVDLDLGPRGEAANLLGADVFVSIHNNAFDTKAFTDKAAKMYKGTTVLYNSLALLPAKDLAIAMNDNLVDALRTHEYPVQDRPGLSVLNSTWMPAVLAEISMFPNNGDAKMISDRVNRQKAAEAIANTIASYLDKPRLQTFLPTGGKLANDCDSSPSNAANHNLAVYDGEWIYYVEAAGDTYGGSDSRIYRVRPDGGGQVKGETFIEPFCNDSAAGLCLYDGYIYYENWSDGQKIYRMKTDTTKKQLVADVPARWLQISGGWLVYAKSELKTGLKQDNNLFKRNLRSGIESQIADGGVENVCVDNGYAYYLNWSDGYRIYRVALVGGLPERLSENSAAFFVVNNGRVYFANYDDENKIYMLDANIGTISKISNEGSGYLSVDGEHLYYTKIGIAGLWKMKLDGTENRQVTSIFGGPITQVGDLLYYRSLFIKK
ncbi:MAG: N-acetylmuramoyl-L-alanine amidase [Negativicutes bacterium]|jgi:N-acetylmuramoyl-L-alanine amidase